MEINKDFAYNKKEEKVMPRKDVWVITPSEVVLGYVVLIIFIEWDPLKIKPWVREKLKVPEE